MKSFIGGSALALALFLAGCGDEAGNTAATGNGAAAANAIAAPDGGDWTEKVTKTAEGGFLMGNPDAPVKVVEYASMTCGHCASFAETGMQPLIDNYVKTGQVSFEIRNFVRDPADLAAALLARCAPEQAYFKITDQLFEAQEEWLGNLQNMSPADQQRLQTLPPQQVTLALAEQAGLVQFVRARGVPGEQAQQCLTDQQEIERLVKMVNTAVEQHQVQGTPSFLINGELVPNAADWGTLEPNIKQALGG